VPNSSPCFSNDLYLTPPKLISRYQYFMRILRKPFRSRKHKRRREFPRLEGAEQVLKADKLAGKREQALKPEAGFVVLLP
jgi:hypothetical protein